MQDTLISLEDVATRSLIAELGRRGFDVLTAGLFQIALDDAGCRAAGEVPEGMVDGSALVGEIVALMESFRDDALRLSSENQELWRRALDAERDLTAMSGAILADLYDTTDESDSDDH